MAAIDEVIVRWRERSKAVRPRGLLGHPGRPPIRTTDDDIREAEAQLGVALPPSYRNLVKSLDWDHSSFVYWLGKGVSPGLDMMRVNALRLRPSFLVAVCPEGSGDEFCFDTRTSDHEGEYPIVLWDHEVHNAQSREFDRIAADLGEFLLMIIE